MGTRTLTCAFCQGQMSPFTGPRHNRNMGGFLLGAGLLSSLFWIGPVLGIPLLIMGAYMTGAKRELWVCRDCHTAIERIQVKLAQKPRTEPVVLSPAQNKMEAGADGSRKRKAKPEVQPVG